MKEEQVFWLGGQPGRSPPATASPADLEALVRAACRQQGLQPRDFVAALGTHGSWLISLERGPRPERVVWNGRDGRLVLQASLPAGGWEDLCEQPLAAPGADSLGTALAALLASHPRGA